ncbi:MAG: hypothetical protein ABI721_03405 [Candidatus Dojkabacteria bacterium]
MSDKEKETPIVQVIHQDNTFKTVFIVLATLAILFVCCICSCLGLTLAASYSTSYRLSNQLPSDTTYKVEKTSFLIDLKKVTVDETKYDLTLNVKNTGKTGSVFSTANLNLLLDNNTPVYNDYFASLALPDTLNQYIAPGATITGKVSFDIRNQVATKIDLQVKDSSYKVTQTIKIK